MSHDAPLPVRIADQIKERIGAGEFPIGHKLPSERLLAEEADVSRQVVRQALADLCRQGFLDCQPRCRPIVIAVPKPATGRAHVKAKTIYLLVFPHISDFIASQMLRGVQRGTDDPDVNLVIPTPEGGRAPSPADSERKQLLSVAADPMASGAIVFYIGGQRNLPALQAVRDAGIPLVFVDREPPEGFDADYVGTDNFEASRNAVQHLIDLGHRRIAMMSNLEDVSSVRERERGYLSALEEAGIQAPVIDQVDTRGSSFSDAIRQSASRLFKRSEPPTAIFAVNDQVALRLLPILDEAGLHVPSQVSVVGFDGWLRWLPGGGILTSAGQQFERMGHLAANLLLQRVHHGEPSAYRHLILEAPLILKGSTQAPAPHQLKSERTDWLEEIES